MSQIGSLSSSVSVPDIKKLIPDAGGNVPPNGAGNINIVGGTGITTTGTTITNTLTIDTSSDVATSFLTDDLNVAIPVTGVLEIEGGNNISTSSAVNIVTIDVAGTTDHALQIGNASGSLTSLPLLSGQIAIGKTGFDPVATTVTSGNNILVTSGAGSLKVDVAGTTNRAVQIGNASGALTSLAVGSNGQLLCGATGANPAFTTLTSTGSTIAYTPGVHTLNLEAAASVSNSFPTDAGTATPAAHALTVAGGTNLNSAGAGSTVTLNLDTALTAITSVTNTDAAFTLNTGTGALSLSNDASATTVAIATGGAVKTASFGSTNGASVTTIACGTGGCSVGASANEHSTTLGSTTLGSETTVRSGTGTLTVVSTGGPLTINSGIGALGISTDNSATIVQIGTGGAEKDVTVGSKLSTSLTTVQSGSGALKITAAGGALTINSGIGALSISNDASATTVNVATGAAAKVVTLGSTNGASSLALNYGTADFTIASVTGTTMSILDTGEMTMPLQSAFFAYLPSNVLNVTGNGTEWKLGTTTAFTETFDQNADFNVNGTFTAPVGGRYRLGSLATVLGTTQATSITFKIITSNRSYFKYEYRAASALIWGTQNHVFADMDAGDTAEVKITVAGEAADSDDIGGSGDCLTYFYGELDC